MDSQLQRHLSCNSQRDRQAAIPRQIHCFPAADRARDDQEPAGAGGWRQCAREPRVRRLILVSRREAKLGSNIGLCCKRVHPRVIFHVRALFQRVLRPACERRPRVSKPLLTGDLGFVSRPQSKTSAADTSTEARQYVLPEPASAVRRKLKIGTTEEPVCHELVISQSLSESLSS